MVLIALAVINTRRWRYFYLQVARQGVCMFTEFLSTALYYVGRHNLYSLAEQ